MGIDPATSWLPVGHASDLATDAGKFSIGSEQVKNSPTLEVRSWEEWNTCIVDRNHIGTGYILGHLLQGRQPLSSALLSLLKREANYFLLE